MDANKFAMLNGWEIFLIMAVVLVLLFARLLPDLTNALLSVSREERAKALRAMWKEFTVWLAQGFGLGLIPYGTGTVGSLLGVVWFLALASSCSIWILVAGSTFGVALSVWACGAAEQTLKRSDSPSVVLDEIVAIPFCLAGWVRAFYGKHGSMPVANHFLGADTWPGLLGLFAA